MSPDRQRHENLDALEGFAGELHRSDEGVYTWSHEIDWSPTSSLEDAGTLDLVDDSFLYENGVHQPYVEHWHRMGVFDQAEYAWAAGSHRDTGAAILLVRAGTWFGFARERVTGKTSSPGSSHTLSTSDIEQQPLIHECEISIGSVLGDKWLVEVSTIPEAQGRRLGAPQEVTPVDDHAGGQSCSGDRWTITETGGALSLLPAFVDPAGGLFM